MSIHWKSKATFMALALPAIVLSACQSGAGTDAPATSTSQAVSTNGAASQMPAFYDGELFTVNMKEMPAGSESALIKHNGSINQIYASNDLDEEQDFMPVLDAIQGDGSIRCGNRTSSFSIRGLRPTNSFRMTRSSRPPLEPTPKSHSS